jgi:hypothetical protein
MLLVEMGMLLLLLMMTMMEIPWMVMRAERRNPFSELKKVGLRLRCWSDF